MKYDTLPIPSKYETPFNVSYMEAKVMEDLKIIKNIVENYDFRCITESTALSLIDIVRKNEGELMDLISESMEILYELPKLDGVVFVGEGVLPFKDILHASDETSFRKESVDVELLYESNNNIVHNMANAVMNEKRTELSLYKESNGEKGFDELTRSLYKTFPDERLDRLFVFEHALHSKISNGSISIENAIIGDALIDHMFEDPCVGNMAPVVPLTSFPEPRVTAKSVKDMVAGTTAEISEREGYPSDTDERDLFGENDEPIVIQVESSVLEEVISEIGSCCRENGLFIALEGAVYKNNIVFDSEAKKLFTKLRSYLKLSNPQDDNESLKSLLNMKKDRYNFNFANSSVEPDEIRNMIVSCGFKPIKENNMIIKYEKTVKNILISVEFIAVDSGVQIYYVNAEAKESAEDIEEKVSKYLDHKDTGVKEAAKRAHKLLTNKDVDKDDVDEAVRSFEHILDNYNDVQKEKEVVERTSDEIIKMIQKSHNSINLITEWCDARCGEFISESHALFEKTSEDITCMKETTFDTLNAAIRSSYEESVKRRKEEIVRAINNIHPDTVTLEGVDDYMIGLLRNNPYPNVSDACCTMLEHVFDKSVSDVDFTCSVAEFSTALQIQLEAEDACVYVLNQAEFINEQLFGEETHDIDDDIKPVVEMLNRLGYNVKYSCSGHNRTRIKEDNYRDGIYHGKLYTTARITFDKKYDFKSAPEGWYFNKNSDKSSMYVRAFSYDKKDGTPDEAFENWKSNYMKALKNWVDNLNENKTDENKTESTQDPDELVSMLESFFDI